jgi:heptosyltransferase-2
MELATTPDEERAADDLLARANIPPGTPMALLNPGGNNPAKRWPPERFAALADHLAQRRNLTILINGSPAEADLVSAIAAACRATQPPQLPGLGINLGSLKALTRRCRLMVTNDTGPRHIAAAFGVPLISLFGPTDPRWTLIPTRAGETILTADPTLPETELAEDHPERCRIERIELSAVLEAADRALTTPAAATA